MIDGLIVLCHNQTPIFFIQFQFPSYLPIPPSHLHRFHLFSSDRDPEVESLNSNTRHPTHNTMHPPRLSSDAPEVVRPPHQESPDKYIVRFSERFTHPATHLFQYKPPSSTPSDGRSPELQQGRGQGSPLFDRDTVFPSPPRGYEPRGYDPLPFPNGSQRQEKRRKGRQCGLWVVVVLVVTAFLLGGGIGGGVGGAFALVDESKLSKYVLSPLFPISHVPIALPDLHTSISSIC